MALFAEELPRPHRLVVLVPDTDLDEAQLAHHIWALASPVYLDVLFLSLFRSPEAELRARRRLAVLAAITRDDRIRVEARVCPASSWEKAIRGVWQPGDLVVCHAEQWVMAWGRPRPLSDVLLTALNAPICVLSGFYLETPAMPLDFWTRMIHWAVPVSIVVGFLWLQVQIQRLPENGLQTLLLSLSVLAEYGLIALWVRFTM